MILLLALLLDLALAEPPTAVHPVVWMGRYLSWAGKRLPDRPWAGFAAGALAWCVGFAVSATVGFLAEWWMESWSGRFAIPVQALLLWPMFSVRMLFSETSAVERALGVSLDEGRKRLARIVSRDVSELTEAQVRESALESLSENLSDSVIAPLFWWALFGLPGAMAYRFANTADACWGYRGAWEWKGKWAARADDLLNWIPARATALLVAPGLFRGISREATRTPSPNGGWPMGALALRLGVRLGKPGAYELNPEGRIPDASDFARAVRICAVAVVLSIPVLLAVRRAFHGWP